MREFRIDLNEIGNKSCGKCEKSVRDQYQEDYLCKLALSELDGMPTRCVGSWGYHKIHALIQYFGIFSMGMKNKWNGKLNYIEICSGPGRCVFREDGLEVDGTAMAILKHENIGFLRSAVFVDYNEKVVDVLKQRISALNSDGKRIEALLGDFQKPDELVSSLKKIVGNDCLNLVFIDPTECNLPFQTVVALKNSLNKVDFIINVADGTDAVRNLKYAIDNPESKVAKKYLDFLGEKDFSYFSDATNLKTSFLQCYERNIRKIGLNFVDYYPVKNYYHLLFASASNRGLDFWQKAKQIEPDGQRQFNFGD